MIPCETYAAVHALTAEYWRRVDRSSGAPVDELYTEDALMHIGSLRKEGRAEIRQFFIERTELETRVQRTTRHLVSGLLIEPMGERQVRVLSTVQVMAGTGDWPMASGPAATVGDFEDVLVEVSPGCWRFQSRRARIVFSGAGASSFAR